MPVRDFTDEGGRKWRAWDIRPEEIHPITKSEDYLADCYVSGWIVFETLAGDEKRRLCPWPIRWMDEPEYGLRALLRRAEVVPPHRVRQEREVIEQSPAAEADAVANSAGEEPDVTDLLVVRTFKYPGGRFWTVGVIMHPEEGGPPVLRFASGIRNVDLRKWPKDWSDQPDEVLVSMLRSLPRPSTGPPVPGMPMRRWTDQPSATA